MKLDVAHITINDKPISEAFRVAPAPTSAASFVEYIDAIETWVSNEFGQSSAIQETQQTETDVNITRVYVGLRLEAYYNIDTAFGTVRVTVDEGAFRRGDVTLAPDGLDLHGTSPTEAARWLREVKPNAVFKEEESDRFNYVEDGVSIIFTYDDDVPDDIRFTGILIHHRLPAVSTG